MNGLVFAPPVNETYCLFRQYANVVFTSARRVDLITEPHLPARRGLGTPRMKEISDFLARLQELHDGERGWKREWREFYNDGLWLQAILGEHVPLSCCGLEERGINLAWRDCSYVLLERRVQPQPAPKPS